MMKIISRNHGGGSRATMLALCLISLFIVSSGCALRKIPSYHHMELNTLNDSSHAHYTIQSHDINTITSLDNGTKISLNDFVPFLLNISIHLLQNAQNNIKKNYDLSPEDVRAIEKAFSSTKYEYQLVLKKNLDNMMRNIKYKTAEIFLLDFTDFSNYLLQNIIQSNLNNIKGKLLLPSKWYKHLLKYTILRQQTKILINAIEGNICQKFSICVPKSEYSEYLVECLRHLLNANDVQLTEFFSLLPSLLKKHIHTIKTNIKFRQKSKEFADSNPNYQRGVIDFIDEVITEQQIMKVVPHPLRKSVVLLKDLFLLIDVSYELNALNQKKMDDLNKKFWLWTQGEKIAIEEVLHNILENMSQNVEIWPSEVQVKLDNIWHKVVLL